ncbi:hypothetical protein D3C80_1921830 [compost metagenome]
MFAYSRRGAGDEDMAILKHGVSRNYKGERDGRRVIFVRQAADRDTRSAEANWSTID